MNAITVGYWETRDGRKARVLCTDAPGRCPVKGYIETAEGESGAMSWALNGEWLSPSSTGADLIRQWADRPVVDWSKEREWVKAVAMDASRRWFRYERCPVLGENVWLAGTIFHQWMHPTEYPQFTGNWTDSLCVRPEGGGK